MSQQSKGFIELEWICPNCNSRNPGHLKTCGNCGAPQPENVQFYEPANAKLIQDENVAKIASLGPDIHCPFCGTRNRADAKVCVQCGGDLTGGHAREAGRELQPEAAPSQVTCTNCGEVNPSTRTMCVKCGAPLPRAASAQATPAMAAPASPPALSGVEGSAMKRGTPWLIIGGVVACLAILCIGAFLLFSPSKAVTASVQDVYWQTAVPLQEVQAVHYSDEAGSPPGGAYDVSCRTETHQVCQDKTVDKGNGYAEVVTECQDESQDYCSYTVDEWRTLQTYTLDGHDLSPVYSQPNVSSGQRLGDQSVTLTVYFADGSETYTYNPGSLAEFQRFTIGSTWTLHLNALGAVVSVE